MKTYISFFILVTVGLSCMAQSIERQVISSTGNFSSGGNVQLSSTVGELAVETLISGSITLTQGFQQPDNNGNVGLEDLGVELTYNIYPNPTADKLFISLESKKALSLSLKITDMQGRETGIEISEIRVAGSIKTEMDLSHLANGQYLLHLLDAAHQMQQTFKVVKID